MSDIKQGLEKVPEDYNGNKESDYESDYFNVDGRDSMDSFFTVRDTSIREVENSEWENSQPNSSKSQKTEDGDLHMNLSSLMGDNNNIMNLGNHPGNVESPQGDHHMNLSSLMGDDLRNMESPKEDHHMNLSSLMGDDLRNMESRKEDHHMNLSSLMSDNHINLNSFDIEVEEESRDLYPQQADTEDLGHAKEITPRNSTEVMNYKPCCMPLRAKKTGAKPNSSSFIMHAKQSREKKLGLRATLVQRMCFVRKSSENQLPPV